LNLLNGKSDTLAPVEGFLGLSDLTIESSETLKEVNSNFFINSYSVHLNIKSLNNLEFVAGVLFLPPLFIILIYFFTP